MDTLSAARAQMEVSLGFHMIFAACGIGMPLLMVIAEGLALRTGKKHFLELAKKWSKVTALLFVIGAVSGTALSFELGLLWPHFMEFAGGIIGPAFALEGFAFFIEAIFLGMYLYGWDRLTPRNHWLAGWAVALSGMLSGVLVVAVNAWMQVPGGFAVRQDRPVEVNPLATFQSPSWIPMALHSTLSCYIAVGFAAAGVYALGMLRGRRDAYQRSALAIALAVGTVAAVLQPLSGDLAGRNIAKYQPIKLAAAEAHFKTEPGVPLLLGGLPINGEVKGAVRVPYLLSLMVFHDPQAVVTGLDSVPEEEWPNVLLVHLTFDVMVGCGLILIGLGLCYWWKAWRRSVPEERWLLRALVLGSPLGMVALEAGWVVTEAGRQPWTIYHYLKTADAVTPVAEVSLSFLVFTTLYLVLALALLVLLRNLGVTPLASAPVAGREALHGG